MKPQELQHATGEALTDGKGGADKALVDQEKVYKHAQRRFPFNFTVFRRDETFVSDVLLSALLPYIQGENSDPGVAPGPEKNPYCLLECNRFQKTVYRRGDVGVFARYH